MRRVKLSAGSTQKKPPNLVETQQRKATNKGVTLGSPKTTKRRGALGGILSSKSKILLAMAGLVLVMFVILMAVPSSKSNCQNSISLGHHLNGGIIRGPVTLHPEVSTSHCIKRISYFLDGIKIGDQDYFPFYMDINLGTLKAASLEKHDRYKLTIVVEDKSGGVKQQDEVLWVAFDDQNFLDDKDGTNQTADKEKHLNDTEQERLLNLKVRGLQFSTLISRRIDYVLGDNFLKLVNSKLDEYARSYEAAAPYLSQDWKRNVNIAFNYFDTPVIGYVLALSRSKFNPESEQYGKGLWQIPLETIKNIGFTGADLRSDVSAAKVAGVYTRDILKAFDNNYILMVAYYGVSIEQAVKRNAEIAKMGLSREDRANVMRMVELGIINDAQLQNVTNFFAAGMIALYPSEFGADAVAEMIVEEKALEEMTKIPLAKGQLKMTASYTRYSGVGPWLLSESWKIQQFFLQKFGKQLPISAYGVSALHKRWGLDHRNAMDVGVHPDTAEGQALMSFLRGNGIPFAAFRVAIPGSATGPHIHVGLPSHRFAAPILQ